MTASHIHSAPPPASALPAARAFALGAAIALLLALAAVLGDAALRLLPDGAATGIWLGAAAAVAAGAAATWLHVRAFRRVPREQDPRLGALRLQALLGTAFLVKLLGLSAGVAVLVLAGVKFPIAAAFALTFAGAALVLQVTTLLQLARAIRSRPASSRAEPQ